MSKTKDKVIDNLNERRCSECGEVIEEELSCTQHRILEIPDEEDENMDNK